MRIRNKGEEGKQNDQIHGKPDTREISKKQVHIFFTGSDD